MYVILLPVGIGITHIYRFFLIKYNVLNLKIPTQIGIIIFFSIQKANVFFLITIGLFKLLGLFKTELSFVYIISTIINFSVIFFLWNLIYFVFKHQ